MSYERQVILWYTKCQGFLLLHLSFYIFGRRYENTFSSVSVCITVIAKVKLVCSFSDHRIH